MARTSQRPTRSFHAQITAAAVVMLVCISCFAGSAEAGINWRGNFETGSFRQWLRGGGIQALQGPAKVTSTRARDGRYSARFEVRPNADPNAPAGDRSEVLRKTGEGEGVESWWAWSTYFGEDFRPDPNAPYPWWNTFTQWHHTGNTGQANVFFEVNTQYAPWKIQMRTFGGEVDQNQQTFLLADLERNKWYDFVFHVRWAPDDTGFVEVWVNGAPVVPLTHRPTTYVGQGVYLKQGLYRGRSALTSAVYLDGTRRGTSFADVATPGAGVVAGSGSGPRTGQEVGPANVMIVRRPTITAGRRMHVLAKTTPGAAVDVIVRGPRGSVLGSKRLRVSDQGTVAATVRLSRWVKQRRLIVVVRAAYPDGVRRATRVVRITKRELLVAKSS